MERLLSEYENATTDDDDAVYADNATTYVDDAVYEDYTTWPPTGGNTWPPTSWSTTWPPTAGTTTAGPTPAPTLGSTTFDPTPLPTRAPTVAPTPPPTPLPTPPPVYASVSIGDKVSDEFTDGRLGLRHWGGATVRMFVTPKEDWTALQWTNFQVCFIALALLFLAGICVAAADMWGPQEPEEEDVFGPPDQEEWEEEDDGECSFSALVEWGGRKQRGSGRGAFSAGRKTVTHTVAPAAFII
eukprot:CAMPEP_0194333858 /NCGR_PEP_ID=MMETSP0171-20130528/64186_1 /TAXON_ID=218684 /ORGANISM="Corethron pennatum, Strain L29A3" /LENGTH=241 /DNA_ID=CAMNT_0039096263 /DNA_START=51 /DNA_END=776 /DNA_ORIENTATION=-